MDSNIYQVKQPVKIITEYLNISESLRERFVKESYRLKNRKDRENNISFKKVFSESENNQVVATSYNVWEETNVFNFLLKEIIKSFNEKVIIHFSIDPIEFNFTINNAWLGVYNKSQSANLHHHYPNFYSFCYYIFTEPNSSPMSFPECELDIPVKTDKVIFFPSGLGHMVKPVPGERIVLAGNLISQPPIN